jgi:hypothetical protein
MAVFAHVLTKEFREISPLKLGLCIAAAIAGVIVLAVWTASAGRDERNAKSAYAKRIAHQRWVFRAATGVVLLLGGLAAIPAFAFENHTRRVAHAETNVPLSTEGSELPVKFLAGNSNGTVELELRNPNEYAVHSQCVIRALDSGGDSALEGDYKQFTPDGKVHRSEDYATWVVVLPKEETSFEVDLRLEGEVARYNAACSPIPFSRAQLKELRSKGIPFQRFEGDREPSSS